MSEANGEDGTKAKMMEATYRALCQHGYSDTSISKIAAEFEKSKSLLYYHYENKEDLLEDFLRYILDQLEADLESIEVETAHEELVSIVDRLLPEDIDDEQMRFRRAVLEMRAQAPYHDAYREKFARSDKLILSTLVDVIERGIANGEFRSVNSREKAEFVYSFAYGAMERGIPLSDPEVVNSNREIVLSHIEAQLVKFA
jgi:AcrR family transcriptional regulator